METDTKETINYRLSAIEEQIKDLKNVLLDSKLQEKDIEQIKENVKELENEIEKLKARLKKVEEAPAQKKAEKLETIINIFIKLLITGAATALLIKLGLPH